MEEKKYLKWYNILGYGSGDVAGNVVYAFLSAFVMIYLTDSVGLDSAVIGVLILVSKIFDGISDVAFGGFIDRTKSRMGKARPWMFWGYFGCAITLIACFAVPESMGKTGQYIWFFIAYTLLNSVFFTANNIAYSALTALITKNNSERVQMGSARFIFAFATSMIIQTITVGCVSFFGGGVAGWRIVAIIFALVGLAVNTLSVFSVKELSEEELDEDVDPHEVSTDKYSFFSAMKLLLSNKYYLIILMTYLLNQVLTTMMGMGIYFMKYVLGNEGLLGPFALAGNIPLIVGLFFTPWLVKKFTHMYQVNIMGYTIGVIGRILLLITGLMGNIPLMLICSVIASLGTSALNGTLNALIAETSEYTFLTKKKRIDGTMFSCTSLGVKVGGGIATALAGWMLSIGHYQPGVEHQPDSAIAMLNFMYLWFPAILVFVVGVLLSRLTVEKTNEKLRAEQAQKTIAE